MRRDFGSNLKGLLFEPINEILLASFHEYIIEAIRRWEKRVELLNVDILLINQSEGKFGASIDFITATQNHPLNMVFPFFLANLSEEDFVN